MKRSISRNARSVLFGAAMLVTIASLAGCYLVGGDTGTLVVSLSPQLATRTIQPDISMDVHHYVVSGTGPGAPFEQRVETDGPAVAVQSSLIPGEWTITVEAFNGETEPDPATGEPGGGVIIGSGTTSVVIAAGEVADVTVTVLPLPGTGSLSLDVSWPAGVLTNPTIQATLTPADGAVAGADDSITFLPASDADADTVVYNYSNPELRAGYYTLTIQLVDEVYGVMWGTVEAVRIIAGQETKDAFPLIRESNVGGLSLSIVTELDNPFEVTLDVPADTVFQATEQITVTATAEAGVTVNTWSWYLQADELVDGEGDVTIVSSADAGTSTITLGPLAPQFYELDVMAESGGVLSSANLSFEIAQ